MWGRYPAPGGVSAIEQGADGAWTQTVIAVGKGPEGIDLSPNGREIWSAHSRDGGVSIIDVATKKVTHTINAGTKRSNRIKLTPDGKFALVSDLEAGDLVVLDTAARKEIKRLPLGRMPEGILIPPDGSRRQRRQPRRGDRSEDVAGHEQDPDGHWT